MATSRKFTTYDFKADWFATDSSREALNTRRKPKTERDPSSRFHRDFKLFLKLHLLNSFEFCCVSFWGVDFLLETNTLPKTKIAPLKNGSNASFLLGFGLFSGAVALSFRKGMFFSEISTVAPRYSSLEADEFDEGSAAEEADASVTRSSLSAGRH